MANQTDVQKLIQGLAPGAVNNGNPNTIYNTPATVSNQAPVVPHVASLPPVDPNSQLGAWVAPHAPTQLNLPQWRFMTPQPGNVTSNTPPVSTPGDTVTPVTGGTNGNADPLHVGSFDNSGEWHPGSGSMNMFGDNALFNQSFSIYDPAFKKAWGIDSVDPQVRSQITDANGNIDEAKTESFLSSILPKTSDGGVDWMEALDRITEIFPLLNGVNWHDADSNKINIASSAIQVAANALGLGPIVRFFAKILGHTRTDITTTQDGCVTLDTYIDGFGYARNVKVGDTLKVIDPMTFEIREAEVSYSEVEVQPTVRITTKSGVVLECSKSAPICDEVGDEVRAEDLLGVSIPVCVHGMIEFEVVMKVEGLGDQEVQHITCENNYFLAGEEKDKYLLHHNVKQGEGRGVNAHKAQGSTAGLGVFRSGDGGSFSTPFGDVFDTGYTPEWAQGWDGALNKAF